MKRELGIARCGLACCLCSENVTYQGCHSNQCPGSTTCINRNCSMEKGSIISVVGKSTVEIMEPFLV